MDCLPRHRIAARFRSLLVVLVTLIFVSQAPAQTRIFATPTEAAAMAAADNDHTAYTLPPDKLAKAEALKHQRTLLYFGDAAWDALALLLILELGIAARMRNAACSLTRNRWVQAMVFLTMMLLLTGLLELPLSIYGQSVQRTYGLSVESWPAWLWDHAKELGLAFLPNVFGVMILFWLMKRFPKRWWLPSALILMAFTVFAVFWYPYVVDPLFNRFEPLSQSHPELVTQLERVVARQPGFSIPPDRMFLMKASDKVTTLNAYVTGFGASKRVVVWDNSITKGNTDEVLDIFGHEMGHYVLGHVTQGMLLSFPLTLAAFWLGFHIFQFLLRQFGTRWGIPSQNDWAALVIMLLVINALSFFSEPVQNTFSRSVEHAADVYGQEVVHGIIADPQATGQATEQLLGEDGYSAPDPSPFVTFWASSHPPTWWRAAFAKHYDPWAPGAAPKYFRR